MAALERALAFNLSGHILHSIFWRNITPKGGGRPYGDFSSAIEKDFGGFQPFRKQLMEAAGSMRILPHRHGTDGAFAVRLVRKA